jgi:hypothetical protein
LIDNTPPTITAGDTILVYSNADDCSYDIVFSDLGISTADDCSDQVEITIIPPVGTELNAPESTIQINATDACGNISNSQIVVSIVDTISPVAITNNNLAVSLNSDGFAYIYADVVNKGSYDNCNLTEISIARYTNNPCNLSTSFGNHIQFCCEDVIVSPIQAIFKVVDASGNVNSALVDIVVQDKIAPSITCPSDLTINCDDNYQNIFAYSGANLEDLPAEITQLLVTESIQTTYSCDAYITYNAIDNSTDCGEGTINLSWYIYASSGKSDSCSQTIFIEFDQSNRLRCEDISFESGSIEEQLFGTLPWCDDNGLIQIDTNTCLAIGNDLPAVDDESICGSVGINFSSDTLQFEGVCKKIIYNWAVIDHCIFDANYIDPNTQQPNPFTEENGYFSFTATISVYDKIGPVISCSNELFTGCDAAFTGPIIIDATDNCTEINDLEVSWQIDLENNGVIDFSGIGNEINASDLPVTEFALGTHRVIWSVSDECNNNTEQECLVEIFENDLVPPVAFCSDGIEDVNLGQGSSANVFAIDYDAGSFDGCDDEVQITLIPENIASGISENEAWSSSTSTWQFFCQDIPNGISILIDVRIYATDDNENYSWCTKTLRLIDNADVCADNMTLTAMIRGKVITEESLPVDSTNALISSTQSDYPILVLSNQDGIYELPANPMYNDYNINPERDHDYLNGVSTLDLILIQKYILGLLEFDSAYKVIAADINNDEKISALDLLHLRKLLLGHYPNDELPNNESWKFVDAEQSFNDINNPWPIQEELDIIDISEDRMKEDFIGVKIGDVNASLELPGFTSLVTRSNENLVLSINDAIIIPGRSHELVITADNFDSITGMQFTLYFDPLKIDYEGFRVGDLELGENNFGLSRIDEGIISLSWNDSAPISKSAEDTLFIIKLRALQGIQLSEEININSLDIEAEAYRGNRLDILGISTRFIEDNDLVSDLGLKLYQNEPNPFIYNTTIEFYLPESGRALLRIYDLLGNEIKMISGEYQKGYNSINLSRTELNVNGVLFYSIDFNNRSRTRKMILIE